MSLTRLKIGNTANFILGKDSCNHDEKSAVPSRQHGFPNVNTQSNNAKATNTTWTIDLDGFIKSSSSLTENAARWRWNGGLRQTRLCFIKKKKSQKVRNFEFSGTRHAFCSSGCNDHPIEPQVEIWRTYSRLFQSCYHDISNFSCIFLFFCYFLLTAWFISQVFWILSCAVIWNSKRFDDLASQESIFSRL